MALSESNNDSMQPASDADQSKPCVEHSPDGDTNHENVCTANTPDDDDDSVGPPLPPDGGYGWVVMCASFMINVLVDGVCFSFGIFFLEFLAEFRESKEQTSWVGSVLNGMYLGMGPIVSALANKFGCRVVTIVGSIIASAALILSTFSPNIHILILTYGGLVGFGFGLMYLPAIVMVGFYFDRRRALATGVAVCGAGIGGFVFAPMCEKLLEVYNWRGATWILAGIILNGVVCGALFRPLEPQRKKRKSASISGDVTQNTRQVSPQDAKECTAMLDKLQPNGACPPKRCDTDNAQCIQSLTNLSPCTLEDGQACNLLLVSKSYDNICVQTSHDASLRNRVHHLKSPLQRKDIFYSGSVHNLPEYKQSNDRTSYTRSVTNIPQADKPQEVEKCCSVSMCKSMANSMSGMMDFSLLKNPVFCIYGFSCFLCMTGFFVPFIYLPDNAVGHGIPRDRAAYLLSIIGISNTIARVACGWVSDQPWADCLIINNCALLLGGIATILCPFAVTYGWMAAYAFVFGISIAAFVSLRSIIMVELMGLEKLTNAFGLVTMCQGMSAFIGAPIAGALFDASGTYHMSFFVAGGTLAMAGIICFPLRRVDTWWKKRELAAKRNGAVLPGSTHVKESNGETFRNGDMTMEI